MQPNVRSISTLVLVALVGACGNGSGSGSDNQDRRADGSRAASPSPSGDEAGLLCDRIDDDEAFTPPGAVSLDMPDITNLSGERRCMAVIGGDLSHEELRRLYRTALADRGFEIDDWVETEGIVQGNLGRTFIRGTKPGLQVHLTIDEFDPEQTSLSEHRIQVKMQFDRVSG